MIVPKKNIPTYDYDTKEWSTTSFDTQLEFGNFLLKNCWKKPGEYRFHEDKVAEWNKASTTWSKTGLYTSYANSTPEYNDFWDFEERKSRLGVIWKDKENIWYTTRDYYFFINFCPIINKENGYNETFATIRDGQYHMMLYEKLAEIFHLHSAILKRRQFLFSYCHVAKSINYLWFENRKRLKWFASDEAFINDVDGSWSILNQYKTHINNHTDWIREFSPDTGGEIRQRQQVKINNKWEWEGNESTIVGKTLNKDPKKGVGGPTFWAWYEEGGIAPTADTTLQFMEPALTSGLSRVGSFCIGGSVGDLKECKPLEKFIKDPNKYGFFGVETDFFDESGQPKVCGLFVPAQWGMPEATDRHGNSLVDLALELLEKAEFHGFKAGEYGYSVDVEPWTNLDPKDYILKKSQNPKNIKEAFAWRDVSEFDAVAIQRQQEILKIRDKENSWDFKPIKCLLYKDSDGKTKRQLTNLPEEIGYPVDPKMKDKRGVVIIYEEPEKNAPFYTYFAGVDPVEGDTTETSKSVFSISIWKRPVEEEYLDDDGEIQVRTTGACMVANWRGRFDTAEKTNEHASWLIQMYNAYTLNERNKPNFQNFMIRKMLSHLLAKEREIDMYKENTPLRDNSGYGFYKGSNGKAAEIFKDFKKIFREYLHADFGSVTVNVGTDKEKVIKTIKGLDRIPDYWFLEELKFYNDDNIENFDRIISDFAGYYIMQLYSTRGGVHRVKVKNKATKKVKNDYLYNYINKEVIEEFNFTSY